MFGSWRRRWRSRQPKEAQEARNALRRGRLRLRGLRRSRREETGRRVGVEGVDGVGVLVLTLRGLGRVGARPTKGLGLDRV